jgi:F0F1-type ATP synthase assembly protein I
MSEQIPNPDAVAARSLPTEKHLGASGIQGAHPAYVVPYDENGQRALFRLRGIHAAINQAKARTSRLWVALLVGFAFGILALFLSAMIVLAIYGPKTAIPPVPGLVMLLAFFGTFVFVAWIDRRQRGAKAQSSLAKAEAELQTAVQEIQTQFPQWVSRVGGPTVLLDAALFTAEFNLMQRRTSSVEVPLNDGVSRPPRAALASLPSSASAGRDFKYRSPAAIFPLIAVTGGVYYFVWIYKIHAELARRFSEYETTSPGLALGLSFVPVFNFIWFIMLIYGVARRANRALQEQGLPSAVSSGGILAMLIISQVLSVASLAFLPLIVLPLTLSWIVTAQVQSALNKAWMAQGLIARPDRM